MSSLLISVTASASSSNRLPQPPSFNNGPPESSTSLPGAGHSSPEEGDDGSTSGGYDSAGWDADAGESGKIGKDSERGKKLLNPFAQEYVPGACPGTGNGKVEQQQVEPQARSSAEAKSGEVSGIRNADDGASVRNEAGLSPQHLGGTSTASSAQGRVSRGRKWSSGGGRTTNSVDTRNAASGGRRGQMLSANHLLNFHYNPVPRPPVRGPPVLRGKQPRQQPYNKELFLQANFQFLVSDWGDYVENASDPDKMLEWEDVAAVNVLAPQPLQCPICLESPPVCPQITSCGHTFCFPCILRYMMTGVENPRGDYYKKCPLCFAMICCKEMRTLSVHTVKQFGVGDSLKFTLLCRPKNSIIPFERDESGRNSLSYGKDGYCHVFSKFSLTSDTELTASKDILELKQWMQKLQVEGSDEDLELLPYGLAAAEQVQQRKVAWGEHRAMVFLNSSPHVRHRILAHAKPGEGVPKFMGEENPGKLTAQGHFFGLGKRGEKSSVDVLAETEAALADLREKAGWVCESAFSDDEEEVKVHAASKNHQEDVHGVSTWEELVGAPDSPVPERVDSKEAESKKDMEDKDFYLFYQAADGQSLILHPLNMKCLLNHYGSYESLPSSLEAKVLELEPVTQTEAARKRYRYLSHLPLTATFYLCEVDLADQLPAAAFQPFAEELRSRQNRRQRRRKVEMNQKAEEHRLGALAAAKAQRLLSMTDFESTLKPSVQFEEEALHTSLDDDESVGNSVGSPNPPVVDERKLFSHVAKLGFASGHDAPTLPQVKPVDGLPAWGSPSMPDHVSTRSIDSGPSSSGSPVTFAAIIQAQAAQHTIEEKPSTSKKGKKAAKLILSTAGGRRY